MREVAAWRNTSVRRTTGTAPDSIRSAREPVRARPTAADPRRRRRSPQCALATALSSWFASGTSTIEHSSTTSRSHSSGDSCVALELPVGRIDLKQPVDRLGLQPGRLRQPLGGPPGRRAQQRLHLLGAQDGQDRIDQCRLADARAAGDDQQLDESEPDGSPASGSRPAAIASFLFDPRNCLVRRRVRARRRMPTSGADLLRRSNARRCTAARGRRSDRRQPYRRSRPRRPAPGRSPPR